MARTASVVWPRQIIAEKQLIALQGLSKTKGKQVQAEIKKAGIAIKPCPPKYPCTNHYTSARLDPEFPGHLPNPYITKDGRVSTA